MCGRGILVGGWGCERERGGRVCIEVNLLLKDEWRLMFNFRSVETHVWNGLNLRTNACRLGQVRPLVQSTPLLFLRLPPLPSFFRGGGFLSLLLLVIPISRLGALWNPGLNDVLVDVDSSSSMLNYMERFVDPGTARRRFCEDVEAGSNFFRHPVGNEPIEALVSFPL